MKDNERHNGFRRTRNEEPKEVDKVALLLLNTIKQQMVDFLTLAPEERFDGTKNLYRVGSYPAMLDSDQVPEAAQYDVYQLDRAVRLPKNEPERMSRMSTSILLINRETHIPAYFLSAYITPKLVADVRVVPFNERGPIYSASISWDSRDEETAENDR